MNKILIIGAGRSATDLIDYLLDKSTQYDWKITLVDQSISLAEEKIGSHPNGRAVFLDITNASRRKQMIEANDLIISMLPAFLHSLVANDCLAFKRHLLTASYVSDEMHNLATEAHKEGLIFVGELGLDPGLDHMSAMIKIHEIQQSGGVLDAFYSYTGGLIAPSSDTNPWHYKFTWNPRNVVLAGQGVSRFIEDHQIKYIPYNRLFTSKRIVEITDFGDLEMYANRDSVKYKAIYGLENLPTLIRGTLRYPDFCAGWDALVQLGFTDNSYTLDIDDDFTYRSWLSSYVDENGGALEVRLARQLGVSADSKIIDQLQWLGVLSNEKIGLKKASPAEILEKLLLEKWQIEEHDKDMIVMQHEFVYTMDGQRYKEVSTLVHEGRDVSHTAMSQLVGLPLGIFAKEVMVGNISEVHTSRPVTPEMYTPVLRDLVTMGIEFREKRIRLNGE